MAITDTALTNQEAADLMGTTVKPGNSPYVSGGGDFMGNPTVQALLGVGQAGVSMWQANQMNKAQQGGFDPMSPFGRQTLGSAQALALGQAQAAMTQFSPEAARKDLQATIQQLIGDYQNTVVPKLMANQTAAGAYNSTTSKMLADDAFARLGGQIQAQTTDTITKYAMAGSQRQDWLTKLLDMDRSKAQLGQGGTAAAAGQRDSKGNLISNVVGLAGTVLGGSSGGIVGTVGKVLGKIF